MRSVNGALAVNRPESSDHTGDIAASVRRHDWLAVLMAIVLVGLGFAYYWLDSRTAAKPRAYLPPASAATPASGATVSASTASAAVVAPGIVVQRARESELDRRFHLSQDYVAFTVANVRDAYNGDARAQYWIYEALSLCARRLASFKNAGGGDLQAGLNARLAAVGPTDLQRQVIESQFDQCRHFVDTDPMAALPPRDGGFPASYWLDRALSGGDALAAVAAVANSLNGKGMTVGWADADAAHRLEIEAQVSRYERLVLDAAQPEAQFRLGLVLIQFGRIRDRAAAQALQLAACESGLDCSMGNPMFEMCPVGSLNCPFANETWSQRLHAASESEYATVVAKTGQIRTMLAANQQDEVIKRFLLPGDTGSSEPAGAATRALRAEADGDFAEPVAVSASLRP